MQYHEQSWQTRGSLYIIYFSEQVAAPPSIEFTFGAVLILVLT